MKYSFVHYLAAKRTVDDRALNRMVWEALEAAIPPRPLRVLEVGGGIGTMVERLTDRNALSGSHYTLLDADPVVIQEARQRLSRDRWGFEVRVEEADIFALVATGSVRAGVDLLIAHAFIDLCDLRSAVPALLSTLVAGGLFYFTLNFDGATILEPEIDPAFDAHVMALYHRTMDEQIERGRPAGDSRSGRHLLREVPAAGGEIMAAGSSDWVVFPRHGLYPDDEAYFLHHILYFIETSLAGHSELDKARFEQWLRRRHAQVEQGELIYIAHQLDMAGRLARS